MAAGFAASRASGCAARSTRTRPDSDGELEPDALAAHYERAGYDVLAITDHWKRTEAPSTDGLLVLPSVELNCILPGARDGHVLGFGIAADADLRRSAPSTPTSSARRHSSRSTAASPTSRIPYWTGVTPGALELPENVAGIEVWNAGCELEVGRGLSSVHWDELLETGRRCYGLVTDDSHHPGFDSDRGWTWLRAQERTPAAVLEALASGSFYGSSGPLLHGVEVAGEEVEVRCSPARSVTLVSGRSTGAAVNAGRLGYRYAGTVLASRRRGLDHARAADQALRCHVRPHRGHRRGRPPCLDEPAVRDLDALVGRRFDLLVIGGGIVGAGIANEAARAGLAVALVDRGDFGAATSSASSKLIHGGLRYLRLGDVKLVREAHRERRALLETVAPHLVRRLPFLLPALSRRSLPAARRCRLGLALYSTLARDGIGGLLPPARARQSVPDLRLDGLRSCGVYIDSFTHDARLCLANVRRRPTRARRSRTTRRWSGSGTKRAACVAPSCAIASRARRSPCEARAVVNATGPWIDSVRPSRIRAAAPFGRLSKGVHLLLELDAPWSAALTIPARPGARHVRVPMAGDAAARDDRHALRGRPVGGCRRAGGRRAGARRSVGGSRARGARPEVASGPVSPGCAFSPA